MKENFKSKMRSSKKTIVMLTGISFLSVLGISATSASYQTPQGTIQYVDDWSSWARNMKTNYLGSNTADRLVGISVECGESAQSKLCSKVAGSVVVYGDPAQNHSHNYWFDDSITPGGRSVKDKTEELNENKGE